MKPLFRSPSCRLFALAFLLSGLAACGYEPTAPEVRDLLLAKGGNAGPSGAGGEPTVDATDPTSAPQGTMLDVRVFGSGYDRGSKVTLLLDGRATPGVKTNSTRFVSDSELVASITIAADAAPDRYDVQVTTGRGKKGVGIELFAISENKFGQLALEITFRDDPADGLRSDGMTGLSYCDPGVPCYEEGQEAGAHLSGNGNLLFWLAEDGSRRVEVLGQLLLTRRIYTNDNQDAQGATVPDLRSMPDGTITSRMIVELGDGKSGNGHYQYGVRCTGNHFERDDAHAIPAERISVTRFGNMWILEGWGARHCVTSGNGKNTIVTETPVWLPFRMTLVAIPWPE